MQASDHNKYAGIDRHTMSVSIMEAKSQIDLRSFTAATPQHDWTNVLQLGCPLLLKQPADEKHKMLNPGAMMHIQSCLGGLALLFNFIRWISSLLSLQLELNQNWHAIARLYRHLLAAKQLSKYSAEHATCL